MKKRPMIDRFTLVVKIAGKVQPLLRQRCTPHDVYDAVLMAISECPSVMISQEDLTRKMDLLPVIIYPSSRKGWDFQSDKETVCEVLDGKRRQPKQCK